MKVLGRLTSINVRKVMWTAAQIDLDLERDDWGAGFRSTREPGYLAMNPNGLIPVLIDGDFVLWESNSICRYLASKQGATGLLPAEPQARAKVEQWMDWQAGDFNNAWRYAYMHLVRKSPAHQDPAAVTASTASWNRHMAMLEGQLARTGAHVAGPAFTLADIGIGLSVNRWYETPIERPSLPRVQAYYDRLAERAAFRMHGRNGMP